ncbi:MAG: RimK/LysX family protein, partial [Candidatus Saccharimonadales bacterium]
MDSSFITIGRAEILALPELGVFNIPARIDTGARTSALWVSDLKEQDGQLSFKLFAKTSNLYTGETIKVGSYSQRGVASSNGAIEQRYVVKLLVELHGKKIRA